QDVVSNVDRLVELVHRLDRQTPQVMIESRIVEASTNYVKELGIQWGGQGQATASNGNPTGLGFPQNVTVQGGADSVTPANDNYVGVTSPAQYAVNLP